MEFVDLRVCLQRKHQTFLVHTYQKNYDPENDAMSHEPLLFTGR